MLHTLKRLLVFVSVLLIVGCGGGSNDDMIVSTSNPETSNTGNVSIGQDTNPTINNDNEEIVGIRINREETESINVVESIQDFSSPSGKSYETPPLFPSFE